MSVEYGNILLLVANSSNGAAVPQGKAGIIGGMLSTWEELLTWTSCKEMTVHVHSNPGQAVLYCQAVHSLLLRFN